VEVAQVIGRTLNHFRIEAKLGEGGMGVVYVAADERLQRRVALKVLPESFASDPDRRARFLREARAAASVVHANIATVHEIGEAEGTCSSQWSSSRGGRYANASPKG
jgi:serine/threonine protein kinase